MRWCAGALVCVLLVLAGCGGGSSSSGSTSTQVPQPPVANAGGPYVGTTTAAVTFSGAASADPQGQTLTYLLNFGDGGSGTGVRPTHTYATAGAYAVTLSVTNTSNLGSASTSQAIIALAAPGSTDGVVYDAVRALVGAHVYLLAANNTGYGQASVSLLNATATGHADAVGAYVVSGSDGGFQWVGNRSCTPGAQLYVYATGGGNAATGLMAVMGNCPASGSYSGFSYVWVNEVSTVAAAYSFGGFATDATHVSSSGTALAQIGIANAFANAANLTSMPAGVPYLVTPPGNGLTPQREINTLANILAACVSSSGPASSACAALFANSGSSGDTATAAIGIAHRPAGNVAALYGIAPVAAPFSPVLLGMPNDWTMSINFTGGGLSEPQGIAIDGAGNVWVANLSSSTLSEFASSGAAITSRVGLSGGGLGTPSAVAIDTAGNVWVANLNSTGESEFSNSGAVLSPSGGFPICGKDYSHGVAVDGSNHVWFTNWNGGTKANVQGVSGAGCMVDLASTGVAVSSVAGLSDGYLYQPFGVAVDGQGAVWVTNQSGNSVTKLSNSGAPVSPFVGIVGGGLNVPDQIAIDAAGNAWVANAGNHTLTKIANNGTVVSSAAGISGGGLFQPQSVAIDGGGYVWAANNRGNTISEFSNEGVAVSSIGGFVGTGLASPDGIAIDGSGNVWVANDSNKSLVEFIGAAVPVVTPLAVGVRDNTLGTRP